VLTALGSACGDVEPERDDDDDSTTAPSACQGDGDCDDGEVCGLDETCRTACAVPDDCPESNVQCMPVSFPAAAAAAPC
jgi:hypothetical protein